jgi:hypothetical protein
VTVRPTDLAGSLGEGPLAINSTKQLGTPIADDELSVEFDPMLATKRQGPYARPNRLTASF